MVVDLGQRETSFNELLSDVDDEDLTVDQFLRRFRSTENRVEIWRMDTSTVVQRLSVSSNRNSLGLIGIRRSTN